MAAGVEAQAACAAGAVPARWQAARRRAKAEGCAGPRGSRCAAGVQAVSRAACRDAGGAGGGQSAAARRCTRRCARPRSRRRCASGSGSFTSACSAITCTWSSRPRTSGALARGMQGFQISAARNINAASGRRRAAAARQGVRRPLSPGGHHVADAGAPHDFVCPDQLAEARGGPRRGWRARGSSIRSRAAISFPDWAELQDQAVDVADPRDVRSAGGRRPQSWLLAEGWKLVGTISAHEVPGPPR